MSTMFIFVLAMFMGDNPVVGTDVTFLRQFDSQKDCKTFVKELDAPAELKEKLACLVIVKPDVYKERDET